MPSELRRLNSIGAVDSNQSSYKEAQKVDRAKRGDYDEELVLEQLARNRAFFGDDGLNRIRKGFVIIVGAGGVGSWAATMLARSGVGTNRPPPPRVRILIHLGRIRVIDFDQVTLSSLNRHASATLAVVGTPKAISLCSFLATVAPFVTYEPIVDLWTNETADELLEGDQNYIVDCIDNIRHKNRFTQLCHTRGLKVISSMGSGCKCNPAQGYK